MKGYQLTQPRVVVLAAGFSQRLGRSKARVRIDGVSLLRRTLQVCASCTTRRPLCILPPRQGSLGAEIRALGADVAVNTRRAQGLSSSVRLGLARGRYAAAILWLPVDLAELDSRDLVRLQRRWCGARRGVAARRLASGTPPQEGTPARGGVPMILPKWAFVEAAAVRGDVGLRDLVAATPALQLRLVALPSAALDVDAPAGLTRARRRYARGWGTSR